MRTAHFSGSLGGGGRLPNPPLRRQIPVEADPPSRRWTDRNL